jgi:hypothetical protein
VVLGDVNGRNASGRTALGVFSGSALAISASKM